jgi:hypothetical protein
MRKRFLRRWIILIVLLIIATGAIFLWKSAIDYVLQNPCNTQLGGTICYNAQGTVIGYTPDEYGRQLMTEDARALQECAVALAALTATPHVQDSAQIIVIVPVAIFYDLPGFYSPTHRAGYCGESFRVIARGMNDEGNWYLIVDHNAETAWVKSEAVWLNISASELPIAVTVPPAPTRIGS